MTTRPYLKMIQHSVTTSGITFEEVTPNFVYRATDGLKSFVMVDAEIGLNNSASTIIAMSKSLTYDVLHKANIPAVEHIYLPHPDSKFNNLNPYSLAERYFQTLNGVVVMKQDNGAQGNHVYKINEIADLHEKLDLLFSLQLNGAMGPYYEAEIEYRIVTFNHQARVFLGKKRVRSWKHNLINGAIAIEVSDQAKRAALAALASETSKAMGLDFCSVDILETDQGLRVIEVNHKVMLDEYCKQNPSEVPALSDLYQEVILQRFEKL
ncbi:ATP-grasp domain-containing protein [Paenibacillus sp. FSL R5-0914]|uniref:ATP-grasp domain-containing protein n=1 Tax=Paenibacillus sp. FSL R5-0914 TaxID=2921665 RepID=UPI0030F8110B